MEENLSPKADLQVVLQQEMTVFGVIKSSREKTSLNRKRGPKTQVLSIVRYASEVFTFTKGLKRRTTAFDMWSYRRLLEVSWKKNSPIEQSWKE